MTETVEVLLTEFRGDIKRYEAALRRQMRETEKATRANERAFLRSNRRIAASTDRMSQDFRRAIAAIALGAGIREATRWGNAYTDAANKVSAAAQIAGQEARSLDDLAASAGAARAEIVPYVDLYARLLRVSPQVAATEEEIARATDLVAKAFKAGGASAQEQAAGIIQLGQALGSGFLQGDELRSIRENAPLVAQAIAAEFDTTISGLKELGAEGELVNDRVFAALLNSSAEIEDAFGATIPSATDAAERAFDRLTLRVGQFITESDTVRGVSDNLGRVLDFVADNLDTLTDAVVIATAALGTGGLVIAAQRAATALQAAIVSAGGLRAALVSLRAVMATLAVPAALAVAAGVLASMALNAETASDRISSIRRGFEVLSGLRPSEEIGLTADEMRRLSRLTDEALESVEGLNEQQREAVRLQRLQNQALEARAVIERREAIDSLREAQQAAERDGQALINTLLQQNDALRIVTNLGAGPLAGNNFQGLERLEATRQFLIDEGAAQDQIDSIDAIIDRLRDAVTLRNGLEALESDRLVLRDPNEGLTAPDRRATSSVDADEELKALQEISNAHRDTFETQRELAARVRDERLKTIEDASVAEAQKARLREQTEEVYQRQMRELRAEEMAAFDAFVDAELAKADAVRERYQGEKQLLRELVRQRDEVAGDALTGIRNEYTERRRQIEAEVEDKRVAQEAIATLEEEYALRRKQIRDEVLGRGTESSDEVERIRAQKEIELETLREALELEFVTIKEYKDRRLELEEETESKIQQIRMASVQMQLQNGEKLFNGLAGMAQAFGGRQSTLYKSLFAVEKAFATASALVNIQQGLSEALSLPFPASLAAFAQVAALGATVVGNIASVSANFRDGAVDIRGAGSGRSDGIPAFISRGESVINAPGTAANPNLLRAINAGQDVESQIASARAAMGVSIGGSTLVVEGDIATDAAFQRLQAQIDAGNAALADRVARIVDRDRVRSTPRHLR